MYKSAYMVQIMISKGSIKEGGGKEKLKTKACTVYPISKKKKKKCSRAGDATILQSSKNNRKLLR